MIKIITAIKILTFNFLFEKIEYEKSGKCKLLKEKEITKIYDEKQTKEIETDGFYWEINFKKKII